jgi:hypothetical protein
MTEVWKWAPVSKIKEAAEELKATIRAKYPDAEFRLSRAPDDRYIWHLWTTVDVDDPDEVNNLVRDRELDLLEVDHIPIFVITLARDPDEHRLPSGSRRRSA